MSSFKCPECGSAEVASNLCVSTDWSTYAMRFSLIKSVKINICLYLINIVYNYFSSNLVNSTTATVAGL